MGLHRAADAQPGYLGLLLWRVQEHSGWRVCRGSDLRDGAVGLVRDGATNIRLQYPTNGTSASCFGTALVKNGPNPENAKAFIDFICSADGQTALAAYQEGTLRYTNANYVTPENAWLAPSDEITWVERDVPYLTENKGAILDHWNTLWAEVVG